MKKTILAIVILFAVAVPSQAQGLISDVEQLKRDNADIKAMLQALLARTTTPAGDPFAAGNAQKPATPTPPPYTTAYGAGQVCDCGCLQTGQCVCRNCNSPTKTIVPTPQVTAATGSAPPGYTYVCGPNGCSLVPITTAGTWKQWENNPDEAFLYATDGTQIGAYRFSTRRYFRRLGRQMVADVAPIAVPVQAGINYTTQPVYYTNFSGSCASGSCGRGG